MALYTRTNLFPKPSAESGGLTWTNAVGNPTMGTSTAAAKYGTTSYSLVATATGTNEAQALTGTSGIAVTAGTTYTFSIYGQAATAGRVFTAKIDWYDSSGTLLSTTSGVTATDSTANYNARSVATAAAPTGAAFAGIRVRVASVGTVGETHYFDAFLFEQAASAQAYFDGSFTSTSDYSYAWSGTAHSSASTESKLRRQNYLANGTFESNATGWTATTSTIATDTSAFHSGSQSLKLTSSSTSMNVRTSVTDSALAAIGQGALYTASAWVYTTASGVSAQIWLYNGSLAGGSAVSITANTWTRVSVLATQYGSNDTTGSNRGVRVDFTGVASGTVCWVDDVLLEQSTTLDTYFDGSTTGLTGYTCAWTGTAFASTSTATPASGQSISASETATGTAKAVLGLNPKQSAAGTAKAALGLNPKKSATGSLSVVLGRHLNAAQTATGSASAHLGLNPKQSATGTVSADLHTGFSASQSATGTVSAVLTDKHHWQVKQSAQGTLSALLTPHPHVYPSQTAEGSVSAELFYTAQPTPLDEQPLQKLADFSVTTAAVPVNPVQGAGQAPAVSATFTAGPSPERVLGTDVLFSNGAIGQWEGEATRVRTAEGSGRVSVSVDSPLSQKLAADLRLFPHMPAVTSTATAGEAVDYWTQTAGMFYDRIDGDVAFYQSGYGHPFAFGSDIGSTKLYEKTYSPLYRAGRTALRFGALSQCAMFEAPTTRVPVSVVKHHKLIASTAVTAGAAGTVKFVFADGRSLSLTFGSGTVTGYCGTQALGSCSISGEGRAWLSLEPISATTWAVKLSTSTGGSTALTPMAVDLKAYESLLRVEYSGTAGARYGTYLAVDTKHPSVLPPVQKDLGATKNPLAFVPGFEGAVWDRLCEFLSVNRLDVSYVNSVLVLRPRSNTLSFPANFARLERTWERKLKYRQVAVVDQKSKAVNTGDAVLVKADTVYQVSRGEVYETTVQTKHSILSVQNPVCVTGIEPFPYKGGAGATGQYVVTGADGYIVSPAYWNDNGGKVEAFLTEKEGEVKIRITAPAIDTVRAPYRISEGAGDRPALYICGSGIVNTPVERHVATGAKHAREGFERVFDSPFCTLPEQVYAAAMGMAAEYSAANAAYDFELANDWDTPTGLGQYPVGTVFPDGGRNVRVLDAQQAASKVSGSCAAHTTLGGFTAAIPAGTTLRDLDHTLTLREAALSPLKTLRSN